MKGNLTREVLSKYLNPVFYESGTYEGHAVKLALELGFKDIYSVEKNEIYYRLCLSKFRGLSPVNLFLGRSELLMWDIIKYIKKNITFWLDGHDVHRIPIVDELRTIAFHPIKTHTILVDDRRVMGTDIWNGISELDVITELLRINPNYTIKYEDSLNAPGDIIVACITDNME